MDDITDILELPDGYLRVELQYYQMSYDSCVSLPVAGAITLRWFGCARSSTSRSPDKHVTVKFTTIDGREVSVTKIMPEDDLRFFQVRFQGVDGQKFVMVKDSEQAEFVSVGIIQSTHMKICCKYVTSFDVHDENHCNPQSLLNLFYEEFAKEKERRKQNEEHEKQLRLAEQELDLVAQQFCLRLQYLYKLFLNYSIYYIDFPGLFKYSPKGAERPLIEGARQMLVTHLQGIASLKSEIDECLEARKHLSSESLGSLYSEFQIDERTIDEKDLTALLKFAEKRMKGFKGITSEIVKYPDLATFRRKATDDVKTSFGSRYKALLAKINECQELLKDNALDKKTKNLQYLERKTKVLETLIKCVKNLEIFSKDSLGRLQMIPVEMDTFLIAMEEPREEAVVAGGGGFECEEGECPVKVAGGGGGAGAVDIP